SFLRPPSRLEQAGKVRPLPEFGDPEIHRAHPGFPLTGSIPIAVGGALIRTLVPIGTHFSAHFELHQGLAENRDGFSKKVGIMHSVLAQKLFKCDAKIGHFRVLLCEVLVLQRMEPESDLFCQDHPLFTPLPGTLTIGPIKKRGNTCGKVLRPLRGLSEKPPMMRVWDDGGGNPVLLQRAQKSSSSGKPAVLHVSAGIPHPLTYS